MKILAVGCIHGHFDVVNQLIETHHPDVTIMLGDLQTFVQEEDMRSSSIPEKHRKLGDFPAYARGEKELSGPVIAISGNHENARLFSAFPNGGFLARNLFYCGRSGVVKFVKDGREVDIAAISGISHEGAVRAENAKLKRKSYQNCSYGFSEQKAFYQTSEADYDAIAPCLAFLKNALYLSHDWPLGITARINRQKLTKGRSNLLDYSIGGPISRRLFGSVCNQNSKYLCAHMHYSVDDYVFLDDRKTRVQFMALSKAEYGDFKIFVFPDRKTLQTGGDGVYVVDRRSKQPDSFEQLQESYLKVENANGCKESAVRSIEGADKQCYVLYNENAVYFGADGVELE